MIKAVIFDLDGVIINSEPVHQRLEYEIFEELGVSIPAEVRNSFVGTSSMDMWTKIIQMYSLNKTPVELISMGRGRYLEVVKTGRVPLVDGILDLIKILKDNEYSLLLASSASSRTIIEVLKWFNLDEVFTIFVGGDQVERSKPNPEIFLKAAELGNVKPSQCLVIEDAYNGVFAAKEAGMYCIGFQSHYTGDQDLNMADEIVMKLSDITLELINKIAKRPLSE
jgi:HAD superfamily hydrolase (TIGR01509 family)